MSTASQKAVSHNPSQKVQQCGWPLSGSPEGSHPKRPILRYGSWQGNNHCLRPMPCLERFGWLCTHQTKLAGVLAIYRSPD